MVLWTGDEHVRPDATVRAWFPASLPSPREETEEVRFDIERVESDSAGQRYIRYIRVRGTVRIHKGRCIDTEGGANE